MKPSKIIYLVGVAGFGLGYYALKGAVNNDLVLIGIAAVYLFCLQWIAKKAE